MNYNPTHKIEKVSQKHIVNTDFEVLSCDCVPVMSKTSPNLIAYFPNADHFRFGAKVRRTPPRIEGKFYVKLLLKTREYESRVPWDSSKIAIDHAVSARPWGFGCLLAWKYLYLHFHRSKRPPFSSR